jgi:hypothetical protein
VHRATDNQFLIRWRAWLSRTAKSRAGFSPARLLKKQNGGISP